MEDVNVDEAMRKDSGRKLKILVVEDTKRHQESAKYLLRDYDVNVVDEFQNAALYLGHNYRDGWDNNSKPNYDVVLTDLFCVGNGMSYPNAAMKEEGAYGFPIVMMAAVRRVPLIAVVTDMNHHINPMGIAFDLLQDKDTCRPKKIKIVDSVCIFSDCGLSDDNVYQLKDDSFTDGTTQVEEDECIKDDEGNPIRAKNWKKVLDALLE